MKTDVIDVAIERIMLTVHACARLVHNTESWSDTNPVWGDSNESTYWDQINTAVQQAKEEIRADRRETMGKCLMILRKHWVPLSIREEICALIAELEEK